MSRAFVREDLPDTAPLPDLPVSPHPNPVTPSGLAALRRRLAAAQAALAAARARPDRSDSLPERMAERDIRYLEARLASAIPVDPATLDTARVAFGLAVRVAGPDGAETVWRIVGEDEADPARGLIGPYAPLARALLGAEPGDMVLWPRPGGALPLEVLEVFRAADEAEGPPSD